MGPTDPNRYHMWTGWVGNDGQGCGPVPRQEPGVRPARALPYALDAHGALLAADATFPIEFRNTGAIAAVFHVRSSNPADVPRSYTVDAGRRLSGSWRLASAGVTAYDLAVHGPNGFCRAFKGVAAGADVEVGVEFSDNGRRVAVRFSNRTARPAHVTIADAYTGRTSDVQLAGGESADRSWSLERTHGWYDLAVTVDGDASFRVQAAGHVETGADSISDPLMGGLV